MALIGNIIWFICGGFLLGTLYLAGAILMFPLLPFLLPMVGYAYWPLGRRAVRLDAINAYKAKNGIELDDDKFASTSGVIKFLANFLWLFTFGILLAICHIAAGLLNLLACVVVVTIPVALPNAIANFKLVPVALRPFGIKIVPSSLADEIETAKAISKL